MRGHIETLLTQPLFHVAVQIPDCRMAKGDYGDPVSAVGFMLMGQQAIEYPSYSSTINCNALPTQLQEELAALVIATSHNK